MYVLRCPFPELLVLYVEYLIVVCHLEKHHPKANARYGVPTRTYYVRVYRISEERQSKVCVFSRISILSMCHSFIVCALIGVVQL